MIIFESSRHLKIDLGNGHSTWQIDTFLWKDTQLNKFSPYLTDFHST